MFKRIDTNKHAWITFFSLLMLDQASKYIIRSMGGFYICNVGVAFGIKLSLEIFYLLWVIIICSILYFRKKYFPKNNFAIALILAGAISNIIDRMIFGCVIDFIDLKFWPVFNVADGFICLEVILILYKSLANPK